MDDFRLDAGVRCGADGCQTLDELCHYISGPALANERALNLKPWCDGTTHRVMSRLEVMPRRIELPLCGRQNHWSDFSIGYQTAERRLLRSGHSVPRRLSVSEITSANGRTRCQEWVGYRRLTTS